MKAKGSRVCSGAIVLFVFVCLLLAGAGRLIASESDAQHMPDMSQRQAWLCAAPNAAQELLTRVRRFGRAGSIVSPFPRTGKGSAQQRFCSGATRTATFCREAKAI